MRHQLPRPTPDRRLLVVLLTVLAAIMVVSVVTTLLVVVGRQTLPTGAAAPAFPEPGPALSRVEERSAVPSPVLPGGVFPGPLPSPDRSWPVRLATANLYTGLSWPEARSDLRRLLAAADVVGLNEVSPERARDIAGWLGSEQPEWSVFSPVDPRNPWRGLNSVLVRATAFSVEDSGVTYGSPASMPGYRIDSRWITWVRLRHAATGVPLYYLQTHMDAAVELKGRPRALAGRRIGNNERYMDRLLQTVRRFQAEGEVVVGGDWNVDAVADRAVRHPRFPFTALEQGGEDRRLPGLRSTYTLLGFTGAPTSPGRYIDYLAVWTRRDPERRVLTAVRQQVVTGVNSDHNPLVATFRLNPPG